MHGGLPFEVALFPAGYAAWALDARDATNATLLVTPAPGCGTDMGEGPTLFVTILPR